MHVFRLVAGTWTLEDSLDAPDPNNLTFGDAVAIEGDLLLVADDRHSVPGASKAGRVYTYVHTAGVWSRQAEIEPPVFTSAAIHFGEEIDLDGGWAVISAHLDDSATPQPGGVAHAYEIASDGTVVQHQELAPSPGAAGDAFGRDVAVRGTRIVVGASGENANAGGAYQFDLVSGVWQLTHHEPLPSGTFLSEGYFGQAVGIDEYFVIGAPRPSPLDDGGLVFILNPAMP